MPEYARGTPLVVSGNTSVVLRRVRDLEERWLQELIHRHPTCLPMDDIEPGVGRLIPACMELPVEVGKIDNLFITPEGHLVVVEVKVPDSSLDRGRADAIAETVGALHRSPRRPGGRARTHRRWRPSRGGLCSRVQAERRSPSVTERSTELGRTMPKQRFADQSGYRLTSITHMEILRRSASVNVASSCSLSSPGVAGRSPAGERWVRSRPNQSTR